MASPGRPDGLGRSGGCPDSHPYRRPRYRPAASAAGRVNGREGEGARAGSENAAAVFGVTSIHQIIMTRSSPPPSAHRPRPAGRQRPPPDDRGGASNRWPRRNRGQTSTMPPCHHPPIPHYLTPLPSLGAFRRFPPHTQGSPPTMTALPTNLTNISRGSRQFPLSLHCLFPSSALTDTHVTGRSRPSWPLRQRLNVAIRPSQIAPAALREGIGAWGGASVGGYGVRHKSLMDQGKRRHRVDVGGH